MMTNTTVDHCGQKGDVSGWRGHDTGVKTYYPMTPSSNTALPAGIDVSTPVRIISLTYARWLRPLTN